MGVQGYDRKRLIVLGGVGLVLVGGLAVFALGRGGGGGSTSQTQATGTPASAVTSPGRLPGAASKSTTTTTIATMPDGFQTFTERNPFQPPLVAIATTTTTAAPPPAPAPAPAPVPAPAPAPTPTTAPAVPAVPGR